MTWRSLLYVPANMPRFLAKAQSRGADALILDLEDSVPDTRKCEAREILAMQWDMLCGGPSDLIVRINGDIRRAVPDLESVVKSGLAAIYVPKVTGPEIIVHFDMLISELEAEQGIAAGAIELIPMIETPAALEVAFAIATSVRRVAGLTLGSEDFATACGMQPTSENLFAARQRIVFAANAAGVSAYGLLESVADLSKSGLPDMIIRAKDFGFVGATAVHPDAIPFLNNGFSETEANRIWAARVIDALDAAAAKGTGAARLDGRMIDRPMRLRADAILRKR